LLQIHIETDGTEAKRNGTQHGRFNLCADDLTDEENIWREFLVVLSRITIFGR